MSTHTDTLGEKAFNAYRERRGGKNHDGTPTPTWEQLTPEIRDAWGVAASAAVDHAVAAVSVMPIAAIRRARSVAEQTLAPGRATALVLTKLDEARMWAEQADLKVPAT